MTLSEARIKAGKTVEDMAKNVGISNASYCFYENGKRKIPKIIAERIACYLDVGLNDIFLPSTFTVSKNAEREAG